MFTLLSKKGLTLIELLMVIIIIGVLFALLVPATHSAISKAGQSKCLNNLKQIGVALHMFMDDYDGKLPNEVLGPGNIEKWHFILNAQYIKDKEVFRCPLDKTYGQSTEFFEGWFDNSYGINRYVSGDACSETIVVADSDWRELTGGAEDIIAQLGLWSWQFPAYLSGRHEKGSNVLFLDGNVRWFSKEVILNETEWWNYQGD